MGHTKATFNQTDLDIGIHTADNVNKELAEMINHSFPTYVFPKQKSLLCRHLENLVAWNYVVSLVGFKNEISV